MIRALIFDFDGLILDTETPMYESWTEIYREAGLIVTEAQWAKLLGSSADPVEAYELLEAHLQRPLDRALLRERRRKRELELLAKERVPTGVRELIEQGRKCGLRLAVASSSDRGWVHELLQRHGLMTSFDVIVCAEDVRRTKPSPDLYLAALRKLNVRPKEAVAFEDSQHGVTAAKAAGLFCVAVPNRMTRHLEFPEADRVVSCLLGRTLREYVEAATPSSETPPEDAPRAAI